MSKPTWWPDNPYPVDVFPMSDEQYPKIVPDPIVRTALSGCMGRLFWNIASNAIWNHLVEVSFESDITLAELIERDMP